MNTTIMIRGLMDEDFVQYQKPSMFIGTSFCNWKCCDDAKRPISMCQNSPLAKSPIHTMTYYDLYRRYSLNHITSSIVLGGLEPFMQTDEVLGFVEFIRERECMDDVVIYTGYYPEEIEDKINRVKEICKKYGGSIIVKFGRYIPDSESVVDEVLGVTLSSNNQFAKRF